MMTLFDALAVSPMAVCRLTRNPREWATFARVRRSARRLDAVLRSFASLAVVSKDLRRAWRKARDGSATSAAMRPALTLVAQCLEANNVARARLAVTSAAEETALTASAAELRAFAENNLWISRELDGRLYAGDHADAAAADDDDHHHHRRRRREGGAAATAAAMAALKRHAADVETRLASRVDAVLAGEGRSRGLPPMSRVLVQLGLLTEEEAAEEAAEASRGSRRCEKTGAARGERSRLRAEDAEATTGETDEAVHAGSAAKRRRVRDLRAEERREERRRDGRHPGSAPHRAADAEAATGTASTEIVTESPSPVEGGKRAFPRAPEEKERSEERRREEAESEGDGEKGSDPKCYSQSELLPPTYSLEDRREGDEDGRRFTVGGGGGGGEGGNASSAAAETNNRARPSPAGRATVPDAVAPPPPSPPSFDERGTKAPEVDGWGDGGGAAAEEPERSGDSGYSAECELPLRGGDTQSQSQPWH